MVPAPALAEAHREFPLWAKSGRKKPQTNFLIRGFNSKSSINSEMVAESVNFSRHRYIPGGGTGVHDAAQNETASGYNVGRDKAWWAPCPDLLLETWLAIL